MFFLINNGLSLGIYESSISISRKGLSLQVCKDLFIRPMIRGMNNVETFWRILLLDRICQLTICISFVYHLYVICMSFVCHLHVICMSFACHLHVICMSFACHLHVICMSFACHLHVICMSFVCHLHVICMSLVCH